MSTAVRAVSTAVADQSRVWAVDQSEGPMPIGAGIAVDCGGWIAQR